MSRRVIANVVVTIDGRTTGPGGAQDMTVIAPHGVADEARDMLVDMTQATTALMGRKNYEGFAGWWPAVATMPDADPRDRAFSEWLNSVQKVAFSRTLTQSEWGNTTILDEDPAEAVAKLKGEQGGDIRVLSSGSIIRQLLAASLVDRLELTISPEIVGEGGEQLFGGEATARSSWEVVREVRSGSGAIILTLDRKSDRAEGEIGTTEIRQLPARRVLQVRETVDTDRLTEFQGRAFAAIWAALQAAGKTSTEHPYMRCHHEDATSMDVEVGLPIDDVEYAGSVTAGSLPGGPALVHTHYGSHAKLGDAYAAVATASTDGLARAGAPWEVYEWCDFQSEPNPATWPLPDDWTTLLVQPLEPQAQTDA